jgi:hypothetical protein
MVLPAQIAFEPNQGVTHVLLLDVLFFLQASEQYSTCSQFLAQAFRQVMSLPHTWQGLLGRFFLLPLKDAADFMDI